MTESKSARDLAAEAKELADEAAENVEHTRPDDEDMAGADVEQNDPRDRVDADRPDQEGEELTDPGAPMP